MKHFYGNDIIFLATSRMQPLSPLTVSRLKRGGGMGWGGVESNMPQKVYHRRNVIVSTPPRPLRLTQQIEGEVTGQQPPPP